MIKKQNAGATPKAPSKNAFDEHKAELDAVSRSLAVINFSPDGTIQDANTNFLRTVGYDREEIVGRHHRMFVDPAYAASVEYEDFWRGLRAGAAVSAEFQRFAKGGKTLWLQAIYSPVFGPDGAVTKVVKYAFDLTAERARQAAEKTERERMLAESLRVKGALDASRTTALIIDETFHIVYANDSIVKLLRRHEAALQRDLPQFRADEVMGMCIDRMHKDPLRIRRLLEGLTQGYRSELKLGGRVFDQVVTPAKNREGRTVGWSLEWIDRTDELAAQRDIEQVIKGAVAGDLTGRVDAARYEGFLRSAGQGVNDLLDTVGTSLRHVKVAVEQIGQASAQLRATSQMMSSGALELNRAAEESATALARTSDSVKQNASSAETANHLVAQTSKAAHTGQGRMEEMGAAMAAINGSAQQIAKIIKVIDDIAFQTNLLAPNAAVEAARAGRHGKGFAVVAQEVRSLAERSARAAKETEQLIDDSVAKVTDGVRIADGTRGALGEILTNVSRVVDLVGQIASASGEQSSTITALSDSMRQVTESAHAGSQQSTEVASAAEELGRQMDVLNERITSFKLPEATKRAQEMPAGITPAMLQQILGMIQTQGAANIPGVATAMRATGSDDPRALLPLDADERGYRGF
ncbi:MAG: methyl-accepting chemotaxis protein [Polyangiales bacterium]